MSTNALTPSNEQAFALAQTAIPGGVNSPVRAFKGVGGEPIFMASAQGAHIHDIEGKAYVDYVGSWGPMVVGHAHPQVLQAVHQAVDKGLSFGAPTCIETEVAQTIKDIYPSIDLIRFVNSGTEATMSALRLARAHTKRDIILKFEGCYHGHCDSLLIKAGSGLLTLGEPSSPGVPKVLADLTVTLEFNNLEQLSEVFNDIGDQIAAVIVEPVAGNMNCIPATPAFIKALRDLCDNHQSLLIFDEVMCGFRVARGGAQELYGIEPDLTCLGKIIGGGMPVGAFGGKLKVMQDLAPLGAVYQAGTLSGNPICMAAGLKTLELLSESDFYDRLSAKTDQLCSGLLNSAKEVGFLLSENHVGGMFGLFLGTEEPVNRFSQVHNGTTLYAKFFHQMLEAGFYFAPSAYEACFMSMAHEPDDIDRTIEHAKKVFKSLR